MKLIRSVVLPWFLFFASLVTTLILLGTKWTKFTIRPDAMRFTLIAGSVLCLMANHRTLGNVGIWMSESLPESLRYGSGRWFLRALKAAAVAGAFWFLGQFSWMPLIWQAIVLPGALTICLFIAVWSLIGPILKFSSNLAWSRGFSVILGAPILVAIPLTAQFVGQTVVGAYRSSQPDALYAVTEPFPAAIPPPASTPAKSKDGKKSLASKTVAAVAAPTAPAKPKAPKLSARAQTLHDFAVAGVSCGEHDKEIMAALEPRGQEDVVFWATQAVECSTLRSVVGLPRLAQIMTDHPVPSVRAAAIAAMKKFGTENVRQISYLLIKRLNDHDPAEVIEAAATALAPLGGNEERIASHRLKTLLDSRNASRVAAQSLMDRYHRQDLVEAFVTENLNGGNESKRRAVDMICLLPQASRVAAESHVGEIVGLIHSPDSEDAGVRALNCMGTAGYRAIRDEVNRPQRLDRAVAAQVLSEMNVRDQADALETAENCAHDKNESVRKWCSESLGHMGAPALPHILALLQSSDASLKEAGRIALESFDDPQAKEELKRVRADNSGWMANNKKLQIAKAVSTALLKIETGPAPTEATQGHTQIQ